MSRPRLVFNPFREAINMWSLFILPVALLAMTKTIYSVMGGPALAYAVMGQTEYQRRRAYWKGEGPMTERYHGKRFGVEFDAESNHKLNRDLASLATALPSIFPMRGLVFDLTLSEGVFLRVMVEAAVEKLGDFTAAKELVLETRSEEALELFLSETDKLTIVAKPVAMYMEQFPATRTRIRNVSS